jgi:ABC-type uncharacterized transport system permease subunit
VARNLTKSLIAVVVGNVIYMFLLLPYLPSRVQHQPFRLDIGLALDFWLCLVIYGLLGLLLPSRAAKQSRQ